MATFIMDKSEAIASVDDAIRKLVHLSSKEKIWTQEMLLQVNDQSLRLLDVESQVRQQQRADLPSCKAGGGSDPDTLGRPVGSGNGKRAEGREGRVGPRVQGSRITQGHGHGCTEAGPGGAVTAGWGLCRECHKPGLQVSRCPRAASAPRVHLCPWL